MGRCKFFRRRAPFCSPLDKSPPLCYNIPNHNHGDKDHEILPSDRHPPCHPRGGSIRDQHPLLQAPSGLHSLHPAGGSALSGSGAGYGGDRPCAPYPQDTANERAFLTVGYPLRASDDRAGHRRAHSLAPRPVLLLGGECFPPRKLRDRRHRPHRPVPVPRGHLSPSLGRDRPRHPVLRSPLHRGRDRPPPTDGVAVHPRGVPVLGIGEQLHTAFVG